MSTEEKLIIHVPQGKLNHQNAFEKTTPVKMRKMIVTLDNRDVPSFPMVPGRLEAGPGEGAAYSRHSRWPASTSHCLFLGLSFHFKLLGTSGLTFQ